MPNENSAPAATAKKRPDAMTIAIWVFVVLEAMGIAWFIWHTLTNKQ